MTGALDGLVTPKPPPNYRRPSACRGPSPSSPMRSGADRVAQWCAEPYKQRAPLRVRAGLRVQEITKRMRACQVLAAVLWQSQNENPRRGFIVWRVCAGRGLGSTPRTPDWPAVAVLHDARATTAVRVSYSGVNRSSTCKLHQTK